MNRGALSHELADRLQRSGLDTDKNAVQRIESGQRFVTDIELVYLRQYRIIWQEQILRKFGF